MPRYPQQPDQSTLQKVYARSSDNSNNKRKGPSYDDNKWLANDRRTPDLRSIDTSTATRPASRATNIDNPFASRPTSPTPDSRADKPKTRDSAPRSRREKVERVCDGLSPEATTLLIKDTADSCLKTADIRIEFQFTSSAPTRIQAVMKSVSSQYPDPEIEASDEAESALEALQSLFYKRVKTA